MTTAKETPLSKPCTKDCWIAVKHSGTPVGSFEEIGGLNTYVSLPPADSKYIHAKAGGEGGVEYGRVLLWFPDVHSATFLNNQLVMDWFASRGASFLFAVHLRIHSIVSVPRFAF